jgi:threonine/homoserine/homoserine lactone efflux protein
MELSIVTKGVIIGFSMAAPVGPISLLCIRRSLTDRLAAGFVSGLGVATADAFYAGIAVLGMSNISSFLLHQATILRLLGGVFLVYLGISTLLKNPLSSLNSVMSTSLWKVYLETILLTLTNPITIMLFAAIFASLSDTPQDYSSVLSLVGGVFMGSALWFTLLSVTVSFFRARCSIGALQRLNQISGFFLLGAGIFACLSFITWRP